jgi:multidrug efflux system outer membrane protein
MKLGPDYQRPETGIIVPQTFRHIPADATLPQPKEKWWLAFHDPQLNRIVTQVIENNLDIEKATTGVLIARAQYVQARADRFPAIGVQGDRGQVRQTVTMPAPGMAGLNGQTVRQRQTTDSYGFSIPASFEIDLWGRLARSQEAARASLLQAEENRITIAQTIIAEAVSLYLQMESHERRIENTLDSIEKYNHSVNIVERRYKRGLTSILDLKQARRVLAGAEARLPDLKQELGIVQHGLSILQGRYPVTRAPRSQAADYFKRIDPVPAGLPSELLKRRPDIRAAEAHLQALNAKIGVAKAARFPRINLTGSFGYASSDLDQLFRPYSELWKWAVAITQSIFDAGKLKAGQRAAEAAYRQGVADYIQTVLTAFSEVETALLTRQSQIERREKLLIFLKEARATQEVAEKRYERGLVGYLSVLEAQQTRFQAEENLILVELAILANRVTLHRVLGGSWDHLARVEDKSGYVLTNIPLSPGN